MERSLEQYLASELHGLLSQWFATIPEWVSLAAVEVGFIGFVLAWISVVAIVGTYAERRVSGFIQARLGPNRVGPQGVLQPIADGIKLLQKEAILPQEADWTLFRLAPIIVFLGALIPFVALPFGAVFIAAKIDLGLFFILSFAALEVIGVIMAGWAANSKWSLYGGMRLAAQMMSYEIPLGLCALSVVFLAGSMDTVTIVEGQGFWPWTWFVLRAGPFTLVGALIFYISALAATKRAPFDLPEAESELVSGFHTEYSGMPFAFFFMAEYAAMYLVCALTVILFFGGYKFPVPVPDAWADAVRSFDYTRATIGPALGAAAIEFFNITLKSSGLLMLMLVLRWTLPRIRLDQVMFACLKVMLPFSMVCVVGAAAFAVLDHERAMAEATYWPYWIAMGVSSLAFLALVGWGFRLSAADRRKHPERLTQATAEGEGAD